MSRPAVAALAAALALGAVAASAQTPPGPGKVPVVAVAGCLTEQPAGTWLLTNATEPVPSIANAPPAGQPYKGPTSGTLRFQLIGVSEFDLPGHKGHNVLVKGLYIKAAPVSRLNVTSVTMLSTTCPELVK
ncbi:MAG: hypothetical protein AB7H93_14375 [Vicinamibacterales bacterium]